MSWAVRRFAEYLPDTGGRIGLQARPVNHRTSRRRIASATAAPRSDTPSFSYRFWMWVLMVLGARCNRSAILGTCDPWAIIVMISVSRGLNSAASLRPRCLTSLAKLLASDAGRYSPPLAHLITAATISSRPASLVRYPAA